MSLPQQILSALEAASSASADVRLQGERQLEQLRADPAAYFSACAEVLVTPSASLYGRQLVGYQLKNYMKHPACAGNPSLQAAVCGQAVVDPQRSVRKVACSIVSLAVRENLWPLEPVIQNLTQVLGQHSAEIAAVHGVTLALAQIVDDSIYLLDMRRMTGVVIQAVLPYLTAVHLGDSPEAMEVRSNAFDIMATILEQAGLDFNNFSNESMQPHVRAVIDACFLNLQSPPSTALAARCVDCVVLSLTFYAQIDDALFATVLQLMYSATTSNTGDSDERLRIAATEFWGAVLHFPHFAELAEPAMMTIVPVLIEAMVYSDMEMGMLQANANDWQVPDKLDDIRPRHYQARVQDTQGDEGDGEDDEGDEVEEWNLRRVSARTLDSIAEFFGERILLPVLEVINGMMQPSQPWKRLEAAVLALGCICDGCFNSLSPYLPDVSTRLLELLESPDTHFLVVNIVCWTCTQIGAYIIQEPTRLQRLMQCIMAKMQNPSKLTQESATAALERMVELADANQLDAMAPAIVNCIAQCMGGYQLKNRVLLLEVLETVCEALGPVLREDAGAVELLLAPLGSLWAGTPNDSPLLFSFFKCMSSVCTALGPVMQPMAQDIFSRSFGMLSLHVQARVAAAANGMEDTTEPEFLITSADLLSGLFDALGSSLEPLVAQNQPLFMQVVMAMLTDEDSDIRQSGFSLVGDISKSCPTYVQACLPAYCDAVLRNVAALNEQNFGVVSNAAWSLCNLLENQVDFNELPTLSQAPQLPQLFALMATTLGTAELTADMRNMADNLALAVGLMLYTDAGVEQRSGCSIAVAARRFCEYMRNVKEVPQKESAVSGFLLAVQAHLPVVVEHLTLFFDLACSITSEGPETQRAIKQLLLQAKNSAGALWQQRLAGYNTQLRAKLYQVYGVE